MYAQSHPTLLDPMDCGPPGSSVHGILQARILEWVAISFSRGSSLLNPHVLHCRRLLYHWATWVFILPKLEFIEHFLHSWAPLVAQRVKRLPAMWEAWVWSLGWKNPLEEEMATHSSILAWTIPWEQEPVGYNPWGHKWICTHTLLFILEFQNILISCLPRK